MTKNKAESEAPRQAISNLLAKGFYKPSSVDKVCTYDQLAQAIESCRNARDEDGFWEIAVAAGPLGCGSLSCYAATEAVLAHYSFATEHNERPEMYWYDARTGIYRPNGAAKIRALLKCKIPDVMRRMANEVVSGVQASTYRELEDFQAPDNLVCVANGVLDLKTLELKPHTPDTIFLSRIAAAYEPSADCPTFKRFLADVLATQDIPVIEEWFGFVLRRRYWLHVILFLLGPGRNGKGTMLRVMEAFLGKGNYAARTLHDLATDRFSASYLYGRLANIDADVSSIPLAATDRLKKLSGEDEVECERKFKDGFPFVSYAKLVFGGNQLPLTPDKTPAFWSRWIIIEFNKTFLRNDPATDPFIIDKLTTKAELSGILNLAIAGLERLEKKDDFSYAKSLEDVRELWEMNSSSVHAFAAEKLVSDTKTGTPKSDVYAEYTGFCKKKGFVCLADNAFAKELIRELPGVMPTKLVREGVRMPWWKGIRVK
jgi:P4 family phage/plasmid primase-like protien